MSSIGSFERSSRIHDLEPAQKPGTGRASLSETSSIPKYMEGIDSNHSAIGLMKEHEINISPINIQKDNVDIKSQLLDNNSNKSVSSLLEPSTITFGNPKSSISPVSSYIPKFVSEDRPLTDSGKVRKEMNIINNIIPKESEKAISYLNNKVNSLNSRNNELREKISKLPESKLSPEQSKEYGKMSNELFHNNSEINKAENSIQMVSRANQIIKPIAGYIQGEDISKKSSIDQLDSDISEVEQLRTKFIINPTLEQ